MASADRAGNTLRRAREIGIFSGARSFSERIGGSDSRDFYRFQLTGSSTFSVVLSGLEANADMVLLDAGSRVLRNTAKAGTRNERIQQTLDVGTYYVGVRSRRRSDQTRYRLTLSASPLAAIPPPSSLPVPPDPPVESPGSSSESPSDGFDIQFDYRFATNGWFTEQRRVALEAAADVWERVIVNEFSDIPTGRTTNIINPQTGNLVSRVATTTIVDDLVIFVGARELGGTAGATLGVTQPSQWLPEQVRSDFAPWVGTIAFDVSTPWFFDPTPTTDGDIPDDQIDFLSVAVHEIGHVLGFGRSRAFENLVTNFRFTGLRAKALNLNNSVRLTNSYHFYQESQSDGSGDPLMSTFLAAELRKLPTRLDIAVLNDTGYSVNYLAASQNLSSESSSRQFSSTQANGGRQARTLDWSLAYSSCGCAGCMMS